MNPETDKPAPSRTFQDYAVIFIFLVITGALANVLAIKMAQKLS